ncbi:MAG: hypothetical protein KDK27_18265, partial [Leptospiraceae bacterium]|nr:hypothetical protein [Leptospiraceae bacterium]
MSRFRRLTLVGIITLAGSSILHCGNKEENKENPRPIAYRSIQQIDSVDSQPSLDSQFRADEQEIWLPEQEYGWWISDQDIDPAAYSKELLNMQISPESPDRAAAPWRTIQVPGNIAAAFPERDDFTGEFWYRKLLYVNDPSDVPVALELGIIGDRDVLYVNGVQVGHTGTWDAAGPQAYDRERVYVLPENILNRNGLNVILIKVRGYFTYEAGILKDHTRITPAAAGLRDFYLTGLLNVLVLVVYFSVGSYFLFLFVRRRVERENLYFALFAYALVAYQFLRTQIKYEIGLDLLLLKRVEYLALSGMAPLLYTFVRNYFHLPARGYFKWQDRIMYLPIAIAAALAVMVMVSSDINDWNWFNNTFYLPTFGVYVIVLLVIIAYSIYKGDRDAIYMMIGILFFMIAIGVDTATHLNYLNIPRILGYVFIMFVLSLSLILANRFVRLSIQVEDLNRNL